MTYRKKGAPQGKKRTRHQPMLIRGKKGGTGKGKPKQSRCQAIFPRRVALAGKGGGKIGGGLQKGAKEGTYFRGGGKGKFFDRWEKGGHNGPVWKKKKGVNLHI